MRKLTKSEKIRVKLGVLREVDCTQEEHAMYRGMLKEGQELPEGVFCRDLSVPIKFREFYTLKETNIPKDERYEYLQYKQLKALETLKSSSDTSMKEQIELLKTIKNYLLFFVILTVVSLISALVFAISVLVN